ncbi:MAG: hypoxanthine phosphoribosyltransferase [Anaerolineae bacterium]|nr:hypoxanthine phosphoribosyltransferase [Anaerolineae bacterium]
MSQIERELPSDLRRILFSQETIAARVAELAAQISADYAGSDRVLLVGVLKGAFIFLADLARQLTVPHTVDFMALSSYGQLGAVSGAVRLLMDLREPVAGKNVIIVEDIVDTGQTLAYLSRMLGGREPASLRHCAFLRKPRADQAVAIDYLGFHIPDVWVVGYGLDYADRYRTLPYIAELMPEVYQQA